MEKALETIRKKTKKATSEFFGGTKRGEIPEWKEELNSDKESVRKDALKRVIAAMTVGKDVSVLFPDVVKCVQTNNIEMKKLVYLYIMNYAKNQQDMAILAVNTFIRDADHSNPLVRALAVRTMGCIRVERISEYLAEPLRRALKDDDPYVRKTAAVAVAKLYDLNPDMVVDQGFVDALKDMLADSTPMVVANAIAALSEIVESSEKVSLDLNGRTVNTLLAAMNECTEWGQVFILDSLIHYVPKDAKEAETIAERVLPRLQHANSAVVLSAIKVILRCLDLIDNQETHKQFSKKLGAPLVTLLNAEPEIQYVALRNIDLIIQKVPGILSYDIKVFFCKYNDPIYVKMEKLEIMIRLASEKNIDTVLAEFKEYATEIDVEFVRRSVRAIGRCAIKLERAAQRCINVLLDLIKTKVNYVVQEAIIVIKDIFRKYPNRYEMIIGTLCENLDTLDEPEAKASMIWIIGEYAERIENADELLEIFIDTFHDETAAVQLQLLTATVKLFLKRPSDTQNLVQRVLALATEETDNPDLRDRGFVYWRLLSHNPEAAKSVVLSEKPVISDELTNLSPQLLNELVNNIGTLSSVYHKPPEMFIPDYNTSKKAKKVGGGEEGDEQEDEEDEHEEMGYTEGNEDVQHGGSSSAPANASGIDDLLDLSGISVSTTGSGSTNSTPTTAVPRTSGVPHATAGPTSIDDLLGPAAAASAASPTTAQLSRVTLTPPQNNGMQISCGFSNQAGQMNMHIVFENTGPQPLAPMALQFNKNTFGIAPAAPLQAPAVQPGGRFDTALPLDFRGNRWDTLNRLLQIAVKSNFGVQYFQAQYPLHIVFLPDGRLERAEFLNVWKSIPDTHERLIEIPSITASDPEAIRTLLESHRVFFIAKRSLQGQDNMYFSVKLPVNDAVIVLELVLFHGRPGCRISTKTLSTEFSELFEECIRNLLTGVFN